MRGIRGIRIDGLTCAEPVDDAAFFEIVRSHLDLHLISGENPYAVEAHATREMTEEFVITRLSREDTDPKSGVGKALFDATYERNDLLTQGANGGKSE